MHTVPSPSKGFSLERFMRKADGINSSEAALTNP